VVQIEQQQLGDPVLNVHFHSRLLRQSIVGLGPWEFERAKATGVVAEVVVDAGIWIAAGKAYSLRLGLGLELLPEYLVL
jgi:hypothetical protein